MQVQSLGQEDPLEKEMAPYQYSCLENPRDGGAWWAAIHGVAKSQIRLKRLSSSSSSQYSCLENPVDRGAWRPTVCGGERVRHNLGTKPPPPP